VAACARGTGPLPARVRGLGGFPSLHRARVLWVGLEAPGLAELAGAIDHAVAPLGVEPERRPFAGHITVGRVGGTRGWHRVEALFDAHRDDVFGDCCFEAVTIYRSTLRPDGAVYTPLWQIPLSGQREGAIA